MKNNRLAGILCVIFGALTLALELIALPIIQKLDYMATGNMFVHVSDYIFHSTAGAAVLITVIVIAAGIILLVKSPRSEAGED